MLDKIVHCFNGVQLGIEILESGNANDIVLANSYRSKLYAIMSDLPSDEPKVLRRLRGLHVEIKIKLSKVSEGWY